MERDMKMSQVLTVNMEQKPIYEIIIDQDLNAFVPSFQSLGYEQRKLCIVTDSNVGPLHAEKVVQCFEKHVAKVVVFTMEAGESHKNLETVKQLYEFLVLEHFDRKDCLVALGGGVVGDLTGFVAATYLRGIDFIQMPTSLLAMVDSSVGGKTGVDFDAYKNMVGAFKMPKVVYMNTTFLDTLPREQYFNGLAEVIKYGAIMNVGFYEYLLVNMAEIIMQEPEAVTHLITKSCDFKRQIVEEDPTEQGVRALLNFGHTIGHAIEKNKNFELLHGECVALGMVCAAYLSWKRGFIEQEEYLELRDVLAAYRLPITVEGVQAEDILESVKSDKKMDAGQIRFILLKQMGEAYVDTTVTDEELLDAIQLVIYHDYND